MLIGLINRLEEKRIDLSFNVNESSKIIESENTILNDRSVFLVHGHDEEAKQKTARFLEKLRLDPIVLSEKPNEGRTIIEKFEKNGNVSFAVVLMTPDDVGYKKGDQENPRPRVRQNVILELGYFVGRLTRSRVVVLFKGSVDMPSDYHGVTYIPMDDDDGWKLKLARELKHVGLSADMNDAV
ncbi:MAG: nucleotide-binding protein [Pseudomonadota bacterium]